MATHEDTVWMARQSKAAYEGLIRQGYTKESAREWLRFWDDPILSRCWTDRVGKIVGYVDSKGERVEVDDQGREEIRAMLARKPELVKGG